MIFSNECKLPTIFGDFTLMACVDSANKEHLIIKKPYTSDTPLLRIHSECLTGDTLHSLKCDCGGELDASLKMIGENGGILLYLRQEGRGIGLFNKINAYHLQDKGLDTVEANVALGFKPDERNYDILKPIFAKLNIKKIKLITNNPQKVTALSDFVEIIDRIPIIIEPNDHNREYLKIKKNKLGHILN